MEANFDSQATKDLVKASCYDCHSNETVWPWYSNIAPVSWLIAADAALGRGNLNFSEWSTNKAVSQELFQSAAKAATEGEMPPFYYGWMHPTAVLSSSARQQLILGFQTSANK